METIKNFFKGEPFQSLISHFAQQMCRINGTESPELFLAAGLLCHEIANGNTCLELNRYAGQSSKTFFNENETEVTFPALEEWQSTLESSHGVGIQTGDQPIRLEKENGSPALYLSRYWQYEETLAVGILKKLNQPLQNVHIKSDLLDQLFPVENGGDPIPKQAALSALQHQFSVITGGPGTGKTTIVVKLLALMIAEHMKVYSDEPFRYQLVAPTGKAAARLKESILARKEDLRSITGITQDVLECIHSETSTIHRCLGTIPGKVSFRYHHSRPLPLDCLIVDEASMVDLALMSKLVEAVPEHAKIIFLGDEHQLASVEAGSVLGDICRSLNQIQKFQPAVSKLLKSHRFDSEKGIGKLAKLINSGNGLKAFEFIQEQSKHSAEGIVEWKNLPAPSRLNLFLKPFEDHYEKLMQQESIEAVFGQFESFMILCALKRSVYGSIFINKLLEQRLKKKAGIADDQYWYAGKPIMITTNDYQMDLYNGDIGIVFPDEESGELKVYFKLETGFRKVSPNRLPGFETAYAMTVHKSQGSEFRRILMMLPPEFNPIVTRELIYTGLTRAKKGAILVGKELAFKQSIKAEITRSSGLGQKLLTQ